MLVRRAADLRGVLAAAVGNMRLKAGEGATRAAVVALKLVPGSATCKDQGMLLPSGSDQVQGGIKKGKSRSRPAPPCRAREGGGIFSIQVNLLAAHHSLLMNIPNKVQSNGAVCISAQPMCISKKVCWTWHTVTVDMFLRAVP